MRALAIRYDVSNNELYQFRLTNNDHDKIIYSTGKSTCKDWPDNPGSIPSNHCLILMTEEDGNIFDPADNCALATAGSGSIISPSTSNLKEGLLDYQCRFVEDACDISTRPWIDNPDVKGECYEKCDPRLLRIGDDGKFDYMMKIELLCGADGYWVMCNREYSVTIGNTKYQCLGPDGYRAWYESVAYDTCNDCTTNGYGWCVYGDGTLSCFENTYINQVACTDEFVNGVWYADPSEC
jgi:hypothetical protein